MGSRQLLIRVLLSAALACVCCGLDIKWSQYSNRASLPRSKRWRDEMREKLANVDLDAVAASDRDTVRWLKGVLDDDLIDEQGSWSETITAFLPLLAVGCAVAWFVLQTVHINGTRLGGIRHEASDGYQSEASTTRDINRMREARLRKLNLST